MKFTFKKVWLDEANKWRDTTPQEQIVLACLIDDALAALEEAHDLRLESYTASVTYRLGTASYVIVEFKNYNGKSITLTMNVSFVDHVSKQPKATKPVWTIQT